MPPNSDSTRRVSYVIITFFLFLFFFFAVAGSQVSDRRLRQEKSTVGVLQRQAQRDIHLPRRPADRVQLLQYGTTVARNVKR